MELSRPSTVYSGTTGEVCYPLPAQKDSALTRGTLVELSDRADAQCMLIQAVRPGSDPADITDRYLDAYLVTRKAQPPFILPVGELDPGDGVLEGLVSGIESELATDGLTIVLFDRNTR